MPSGCQPVQPRGKGEFHPDLKSVGTTICSHTLSEIKLSDTKSCSIKYWRGRLPVKEWRYPPPDPSLPSVTLYFQEDIGDYFTCPTLGHHKSANMACQIKNCPFCAMFGGAGGGGAYTEDAFDPSKPKNRPIAKSAKTSIKGKKLPPLKPLFRR